MIKSKEELKNRKPEIDLNGPDGNAYMLLAYARRWAKELGLNADKIQNDMTSGDYEHLISVLEKHFGEYVIFYR